MAPERLGAELPNPGTPREPYDVKPKPKTALRDTRKNYPGGILWRGWCYEYCPSVTRKRVMIVEDHSDYLLVSDYESKGWRDPCMPVGELHRVNRIKPGRPTLDRLGKLQGAIHQANELLSQ